MKFNVVGVSTTVTLVVLALLIVGAIPLGVGTWFHPRADITDVGGIILLSILFIAVVQVFKRFGVWEIALILFLCMQVGSLAIYDHHIYTIPAVVMKSGFSQWVSVVTLHDFSDYTSFLRNVFESGRSTQHITSHPPGFLLFHWIIFKLVVVVVDYFGWHWIYEVVSGSGETFYIAFGEGLYYGVVGCTAIFIGAITVIPLLKIGGRYTVLLFALSPAIITQTPNLDIMLPFFTAGALYFFFNGDRSVKDMFLSVSFIIVGYYFNYAFALVWVILVLFSLISNYKTKGNGFAVFVFGFVFAVGILVAMGVSPDTAMVYHFQAGLPDGSYADSRPYLTWVFGTPYMFFLFLGIPMTVILFWLAFTGKDRLAISFLLVFALLALSGLVRGEAERIFLFLLPIPCLSVGLHISDWKHRDYIIGLVFLQTILFRCLWTTMAVMSGSVIL